MTIKRRGWLSKPNPGSLLRASSPLARGLAGAWVFNEGAGLPVNALGNLPSSYASGSNAPWAGSPWGQALSSPLGTGPVIRLNHGLFDYALGATLLMLFRFTAFQTGGVFISALAANLSVNNTLVLRVGGTSATTNYLTSLFGTNASLASASGPGVLATGTPYLLGVTNVRVASQVIQTAYVNGVPVTSGTWAAGYSGAAGLYLFNDSASTMTNRAPAGLCGGVFVWNRGLDPPELAALGNGVPGLWQMLASYRHRRATVATIRVRRTLHARAGRRGAV